MIQCTGYLKSWSPAMMGVEEQEDADSDSSNMSCLVAIGRILPHISTVALTRHSDKAQRPIQFVSRHALDGKFIFVDQRWVRTYDKYMYLLNLFLKMFTSVIALRSTKFYKYNINAHFFFSRIFSTA